MADMHGWRFTGDIFYSEDGNRALAKTSISKTVVTIEKKRARIYYSRGEIDIYINPENKSITF